MPANAGCLRPTLLPSSSPLPSLNSSRSSAFSWWLNIESFSLNNAPFCPFSQLTEAHEFTFLEGGFLIKRVSL